jgi:protein-tyrosine-phosphatase
MADKTRVLFLCTTNAGASQMAEAILTSLAADRFEVCSAGLTPVPVHPMAEEVMRHLSVDMAGMQSKPVSAFAGQAFDWVISIGDAATAWPDADGALYLHWDIADPLLVGGHVEDIIEAFMVTRNDLYRHIRSFITAVGRKTGASPT